MKYLQKGKFSVPVAGPSVTQEAWDQIFSDHTPSYEQAKEHSNLSLVGIPKDPSRRRSCPLCGTGPFFGPLNSSGGFDYGNEYCYCHQWPFADPKLDGPDIYFPRPQPMTAPGGEMLCDLCGRPAVWRGRCGPCLDSEER